MFFFVPVLVLGEDVEADALSKSSAIDGVDELPWWVSYHQSASETISQWSSGIDSFLSGEERSGTDDSYVSLEFGPIFSEDDKYSGFFNLEMRLKLPNTRDRLRLVIESDGDKLTSDNELGESSENTGILSSALSSRVSAALRYAKRSWGADLDFGILLGFPLDPFVRLNFEQGENYESWKWQQHEEMFGYYSKGMGARYSVGASRNFNENMEIGSSIGATFLERDEATYVRENIFLNHTLNERNKLTYQLSFLQSEEEGVRENSYLYYVECDHLLYKNWLIGKIKPQMTHESEDHYHGVPSLTLSIEILLGQKYLP